MRSPSCVFVLCVGLNTCFNFETLEAFILHSRTLIKFHGSYIFYQHQHDIIRASSPKYFSSLKNDTDFPLETMPISVILQHAFAPININPETHMKTGLSMEQAQLLLESFGPNTLPPKMKKTILQLFIQQFDDTLVRILLFVALLSLVSSLIPQISTHAFSLSHTLDATDSGTTSILHNLLEPFAIFLILILNATVGVWQTLRATTSLEALEKMQPKLCTVLRRNRRITHDEQFEDNTEWIAGMDASLLVPGDVIRIKVGDQVPADSRIWTLLSSSLSIDESTLTGESLAVYKTSEEENNVSLSNDYDLHSNKMAFSGTMVTTGSAIALVVKTGTSTEMGKIHNSVFNSSGIGRGEIKKTPLGEKLDELGEKLSRIIGIICLFVWMISIPHFSDPIFTSKFEAAIYYAKVAVALSIAAVPEGLAAIVSLTLALGTRRMAEHNVIVRSLSSVETLGCTTVICSDKTGTITMNQQTIVSLLLFHGSKGDFMEHKVSGASYSPQGDVKNIDRSETTLHPNGSVSDLCQVMSLCNDARLISYVNENEVKFGHEGEPIEAALLALVEKLGNSSDSDVEYNRKIWNCLWSRYKTLEFDRERKSMSVLCRSTTIDYRIRLFVKGAPDTMLSRCKFIKSTSGDIVFIDESMRTEIESQIKCMSSRPLRCLLMAFKDVSPEDVTDALSKALNFADLESNLILLGVTGLVDPPRLDVARSLSECKKAGIRVIMITGDNRETASAIAHDIGMLDRTTSNRVYDAADFFSLEVNRQREILNSGNLVFSRTRPTQKQVIVEMLQDNGEIVAMTGDGVNDSPALKRASIGIAMGSGTDVAKETADMVLLDDSFSSIVQAVAEGRSIYTNMKAFVNFLLSCNLGEVFAVVLASLLGLPSILTATQLLWINLVTDGLPAVALGFNPPDRGLMTKPPRSPKEEFIDNAVLVRYLISGAYIGLSTTGAFIFYFLSKGLSINQLINWSTCVDPSCLDIFSQSTLKTAQTLGLTTLVCTELFKALCSVSTVSLFKISPFENPYLISSVVGSMTVHVFLLYSDLLGLSFLSEGLGLVPITMNDWYIVLGFSLPIIMVEESIKTSSK